jgi:CubicO group peptidase (beta-lactamase class C family)
MSENTVPSDLAVHIERVAAETAFSGVVRVDAGGSIEYVRAFGMAHQAYGIANTVDTRLAIASGTKGFTALAVVALIEDGVLRFDTPAREVLVDDLPLIDDRVTVEHLLGHRSGIGDYLDEDQMGSIDDPAMPVPVHQLAVPEDYLRVLDGFAMVAEPGERFAYNNGGYVVLALIAERAGGTPYHDLVRTRVFEPAGMSATSFPRADHLPGDAATGYLGEHGPRTNALHMPLVGVGDGGAYSTAADSSAFWETLFDGRIVSTEHVAEMTRPRSVNDDGTRRHGLGFWCHPTSDVIWIEGYDAGISFMSTRDPGRRLTHTVCSNTSEGAWPMVRLLDSLLDT